MGYHGRGATNHNAARMAIVSILCWWMPTCAAFAPSTNRRMPPLLLASSSSLDDNDDNDDNARAGSGGYSVLRQPTTNDWNANVDPDFAVPTTLLENTKGASLADEQWWQMSTTKPKEDSNAASATAADSAPRDSERPAIPKQAVHGNAAVDQNDDDLDLWQRSLDTLDYPRVLQALERECSIQPSRQIVRNETMIYAGAGDRNRRRSKKGADDSANHGILAHAPLLADTVQGARERYRAVQEMARILQSTKIGKDALHYRDAGTNQKQYVWGNPPPIGSVTNFNLAAILETAERAQQILEGPDICEVALMMQQFVTLRRWSAALQKANAETDDNENDNDDDNNNDDHPPVSFVELPKIVNAISVNETLQDLLENAFEQQTGKLSGTTFPELGTLRAQIRALKQEIMATMDTIIRLPSTQKVLALESGGALTSQVNGRLVIPIQASKKAAGKTTSIGIVHDTSRSQQTLYVEPTEIVGPTNDLRRVESQLRAAEARVWRQLTLDILDNRHDLMRACACVGQVDLVWARYRLGLQTWRGVIPHVGNEGVIHLREAKHPVLLLRLGADQVVGSDIDLGTDGTHQGLVLTGPNAGGKTVILKLLGLVALLARAGLAVPAAAGSQARVDFFDPVLADIGDLQSVGGDLSTFSGHLLVCREVLARSGRNALVLLDELGSGTDPAQGVALAQAVLESLLDQGARVAITTHYTQLKQLATSSGDARFAVGGMQFVRGRPTYKLLPGTVGESYALAVAERLELPKAVISRAEELLDSETRQMGDLLRDLEDQKALVDEQMADLEEQQNEIRRLKEEMEEQRRKLEQKQLTVRREEAQKFAEKLEEKEEILEQVLDKLKSDPSRRVLAKSWSDIKFVRRDALNEAENIPRVLQAKREQDASLDAQRAELVPLAELRDRPELKEGDTVIVCKKGPVFGRQGTVIQSRGKAVDVRLNNMSVSFKLTQVALPPSSGKLPEVARNQSGNKGGGRRPNSISRAAQKALEDERRSGGGGTVEVEERKTKKSSVSIRTESNTIDVRGCSLSDAQAQVEAKFQTVHRTGRRAVYILHGHGTGGVLKTKIRNWLRSQKMTVKKYGPADSSDGGDAFTRVELR